MFKHAYVPEDFITVPGFTNYAVSKEGLVYNKLKNHFLMGSANPDGYINFRLCSDNGDTITLGLHRILGLAFLGEPDNAERMVINHKNGVKNDNRLENLEWTTFRGNAEHAGANGLTTKCCPVTVLDVLSRKVVTYPSAIACGFALNLSKDAILYRLKVGESRIFPEGKQYRRGSGTEEWKTPSMIENALAENGTSKAILVRDVFTGNVREFSKMSILASEVGVSPATISSWMKAEDQLVASRGIQVKWKRDLEPWVILDNPVAMIAERVNTRKVKTVHVVTGEIKIYSSAKECAIDCGITPTCLNYRLYTGKGKVYRDGKTYSYY